MSNSTGLSLYEPTFDVRIEVPGENAGLHPGRLTWNDAIGIPDGSSRLVELTCCSIVEQPYLNKRLRQLPENARIKASLVGVEKISASGIRCAPTATPKTACSASVCSVPASKTSSPESTRGRPSVPLRRHALAKNHKTGSEQLADGLRATSNRRR